MRYQLNGCWVEETRATAALAQTITVQMAIDTERQALLSVEPLTGADIVAHWLLGSWQDMGIEDPVAWVEARRRERTRSWTA